MPISVADFQQIFNMPLERLGDHIVSVKDDQVQLSKREYNGVHTLSWEAKEENAKVREALVEALTQDSKCETAYRAFLENELLGKTKPTGTNGEIANKDLDTAQLKSILDRHVTMITLSKAGVKKGEDATGAAIRQAGEQAIDTNHLKIPNEKDFLANLKTAGELTDEVVTAFKDHLAATRTVLKTAFALKGAKAATPNGQEAIKTATDALSDLEHLTRQIYNRILRKNGDPPPELEKLIDFASSRHAELNVIAGSLKGLLAFEAMTGKRTVGQMAAMLAGKMHTSGDVVAQLKEKAAALDARTAQLEANADSQTNTAEIAAIRRELAEVESFAQGLRDNGNLTLANGVTLHLEKTFTDGLNRHINQIKDSLTKAEENSALRGIYQFLDEAFPKSATEHPRLGGTVEWVKNQFKELVKNRQKPDVTFLNKLKKKVSNDSSRVYESNREISEDETRPKMLAPGSLKILCQKFLGLIGKCNASPNAIYTTNGDLKKMLAGQIGLETVLGARVYGFDDTMIDERLNDAQLTFAKELGSGGTSTVTLVKYRVENEQGDTGEVTRVFKPETPALAGIGSLLGGKTGYNGGVNTVAQINRAAYQSAKLLGVDHIMPKVTVGMHKKQFGFFMEKAEGDTPDAYKRGKREDGTPIQTPFPKPADPSEKAHLKGSLMKSTNELMWTDWLTGQLDRHNENYLVSFDESNTAHVKGVDNDASFSAERVGLRKFHLNKDRLERFLADAGCRSADEYNRKHAGHPLTPVDGYPDLMAIDAGDDRETMFLIGDVFGINSFAKPMTIGKEMHDKLIALGNLSRDELRREVTSTLKTGFTNRQLDATVSRLEEMIAHVRTFSKEQILTDKAWDDPHVQQEAITRAKANQLQSKIFDGINDKRYVEASKDYFVRDFADRF